MNSQTQPILLVGLTMRMLAELAVRAGYPVMALDYFGDADLQALCPSRSLLRDYNLPYSAAGLVNAAGDLATPAVVYSANLENYPAEVARLSQGRRLLGNDPETLAQVRDPARLADALHTGGFAFPETFTVGTGQVPDKTRSWLWKPLNSGGGHGIRLWRKGRPLEGGMLQERLVGMTGSAAFVANGREAVLLGVTEQLVGQPAFGASGFHYCGNLAPPRLPPGELAALLIEARAIVSHLSQTFGLWGVNGLDFIWQAGRVWTLEVNPRPSASLELFDLAYRLRVFEAHVQSFSGHLPHFGLEQALASGPAAGKAIVYAPHDVTVGDTRDWAAEGIRDIPHPYEQIRRRQPICTLLTTAATPAACLHQLRAQAAALKTRLKPVQP
ncbi:MAG: ATP-grasp domain-containing protein [Anaerolineae bacterium]|nr:ATP-grasp domain-containing protein [Anaerolineae bacterium]